MLSLRRSIQDERTPQPRAVEPSPEPIDPALSEWASEGGALPPSRW